MAQKGQKFSNYSAEYKLFIVIDKLENKLSYSAVVKKYWNPDPKQIGSYVNTIKRWERQYLKNGLAGLLKEYRGRPRKVKSEAAKENCPRNSSIKTQTRINPLRNKVTLPASNREFVRELSEKNF